MPVVRPHLRLIRGGRYRELIFGHTRLLVSEKANPKADGYLFEEDTLLSMSVSKGERPLHTMETHPVRGGTSITRAGTPAELLLIVNEARPLRRFRPGWLDPAWKAALHEADHLRLTTVSAPLVGCIGGAALDAVLLAAASALTLERFANLHAVELVCADLADEVYRRLTRYAYPVRH